VLDYELAAALLGDDAHSVIAAALDVGLLVERQQQLDLHPLARAFLEERRTQLRLQPAPNTSDICLASYRRRREWDAAFELVARTDDANELDDLMICALDDLLETARLSTLQRWCDLAERRGRDAPIFAVARAEAMFRHGSHKEAVAKAELAASRDKTLPFERCPSLAARHT
jgi:hypothetical protein